MAASSTSATTRGVESTGTSPERCAIAVSESPTCSLAIPLAPGSIGMVVRYKAHPKWSQTPSGSTALIEPAVLERVLGAALRGGGDFAEVFVEDRSSSTARYDDGRIEELTSGRDRGAGIRVIVGESTGYAHTADISEAGLHDAALAAAGAARGGTGTPRTV